MRKSVTFVIGSLSVGGAESQMTLLALSLAKMGWHVSVFSLEQVGSLNDKLIAGGVRVIFGGYRSNIANKLFKVFALLMAQVLLVVHLIRNRPFVVHGFLPLTNFMAVIAGRITFRPKIVISLRGLGTHQNRRPFLGKIDKISLSLANVVTSNAKAIAVDTQKRNGYDVNQIHVIPNGLDISVFENSEVEREKVRTHLSLNIDHVAIVNVANLIPYKGQSDLIEAFALAKNHCSHIKLLLVGEDRGIGSELVQMTKNLRIADDVHFLGKRSDVSNLLCGMDIGVLPSLEEGLPNALIEKLASGLPVIASDVGGVSEICEDIPDSILVPPGDSQALANALIYQYEKRADISTRNAHRHTLIKQRYAIDSMVAAYVQIYNVSEQDTCAA